MVRSRLRLILIGLRYLKMIDNLIDYILAIAGGRREELRNLRQQVREELDSDCPLGRPATESDRPATFLGEIMQKE